MEPLIAVVGATGTGKSKLAVDLASRFNGEIINGDAMQMYRGLPIITNQIPEDERNGIPHHLIGCVDLKEEPWRIGIFKKECLRLINEIRSRGKLPILVGGTHYYTQAVLFKDQTVANETESSGQDDLLAEESLSLESLSDKWPILNAPSDQVLQKLREVDPVMADRWHPNETRKIRRSLEIFLQTGRPASEIYEEQKRQKRSGNDLESSSGLLRFPTVVFWVHSGKEVLNSRLNTRVESMIDQGLLLEAERMSNYLQESISQGINIEKDKGVWVSIGFKELAPYFEAVREGSLTEEELESLKRTCVESIKTGTRQYAVQQVKWIRNKLWRALAEANMKNRLYLLDSTYVEDWGNSIAQPSELVVNAFLREESLPDPRSFSELAKKMYETLEAQSSRKTEDGITKCITCDVCQKTMTNEEQWKVHMTSAPHKRALRTAARKAERDEYFRQQELLKKKDQPTMS
ncbi:hypothetical protein ASPZODRAFT_73766 [Penicilliopsis zonata CBS 506.65]|uniref:tRNA dimethylallyltransferase n=1 Tax=Penicilliopsis zonata CBS 506.65 TaxID=1073090 RepID=A0A1L9S9C3_9EURO|nr:hypothetical protein ASPZODRAFT_73766 [Penicilliopsis zonata CBS 506.65]OJJ43729.1 hypothetical protein ASPZODRAFT_73766 [Penicilliopsis zonata CBS 506.65]